MTTALSISGQEELAKLTANIPTEEELANGATYPKVVFTVDSLDPVEVDQSGNEAEATEKQKLKQILPFVVIYSFNEKEGKLKFLQKVKETETSVSTIGFFNPITQEDIFLENAVKDEKGRNTYSIDLNTLLKIGADVGLKTVEQELGNSSLIFKVKTEINFETTMFGSVEDRPDAIALIYPVKIDSETFDRLVVENDMKLADDKSIGTLGLNMDAIIENMDVSNVARKVIADIYKQSGIDGFSGLVINYIIQKEANELLELVTYKDLFELVERKCDEVKLLNEKCDEALSEQVSQEQDVKVVTDVDFKETK